LFAGGMAQPSLLCHRPVSGWRTAGNLRWGGSRATIWVHVK
jgi:hypothetical protein